MRLGFWVIAVSMLLMVAVGVRPPGGSNAQSVLADGTDAQAVSSNQGAQFPTVLTSELVSVNVSVTDSNGKAVSGLTADHFDIFDDNVRQKIAHFSYDDAPISLGIVYDVSGSMAGRIRRSF